MPVKSITKGTYLIVRGTKGMGLTARGRTMKSPLDQIVEFKSPNKFYGIYLEHVTGPMKGVTIRFGCALARKSKIRGVCTCNAYPFPHNQGTGDCNVR